MAAGASPDAAAWAWSSHGAALGFDGSSFVDVTELRALFAAGFGGDPGSPEAYARFVDG